ncbi:MAG: hypothetical protein ACOYOI_08015 [Chthoniobacterales bacterium]
MVLLCFAIPLFLFAYSMTQSWLRAWLIAGVAIILGYPACKEIGKFSMSKIDLPETPLNEWVEGYLDEIASGSTHRFAKDIGYFTAFQGSKLMIQGWIGSVADRDAAVKISFVTKTGEDTGLECIVLPKRRYDVADAKKNPDLLYSGFIGSVTLPEKFLPGTYLLRVEKGRGSKRQFFIPATEIRVAPSHSPGES